MESQRVEMGDAKRCLNMQYRYHSDNPSSDLSLIVTNNTNLVFYVNLYTIFVLSSELTGAVFKENIETAYYREFADAALKKIDQYIQLGVSYAVLLPLTVEKRLCHYRN